MQIIYEKTIVEQIMEAKATAEKTGKVIKEIRLSKVETEQLKRELFPKLRWPSRIAENQICGVRVIPYIADEDSDF